MVTVEGTSESAASRSCMLCALYAVYVNECCQKSEKFCRPFCHARPRSSSASASAGKKRRVVGGGVQQTAETTDQLACDRDR